MKRIVIAAACLFMLASLSARAEKIVFKKKDSIPTGPPPTHATPVDADYEDGRLYIDFKRPGSFAHVNVKDRWGMLVSDWVDTQATPTHVIDATMLESGRYVLEVEQDGQSVEGKFEVE